MEQVHASMHMNAMNCTQKLMIHCTLFMPFSKNRWHFNSSTTVLSSYTVNKIIELRQYTVMKLPSDFGFFQEKLSILKESVKTSAAKTMSEFSWKIMNLNGFSVPLELFV